MGTFKPVCIGTGLIALDVVINGSDVEHSRFFAGGSCGNVLAILSYLGWDSYPIARLSDNTASDILVEDFKRWGVRNDLLTFTNDGSTPIIIHRILRNKQGVPKHRFEFKNPEDGSYLPSYKPCLAKSVPEIVAKSPKPRAFFFDRINRASISLAEQYKSQGSIIIFEPSSIKDEKLFSECLQISDIVKFSNERIPNYEDLYPQGAVPLEVQTLGENGLKFRKKKTMRWTSLPAYSIPNVVDTAGAGDWTTAGLITKLLDKSSSRLDVPNSVISDALRFGQILSALNCTTEGARGLMYSLDGESALRIVTRVLEDKSINVIPSLLPDNTMNKVSRKVKISSLLSHSYN